MRNSSKYYKKWLLYTQNEWPKKEYQADKLLHSWFEDRALKTFSWEKPPALSSSVLYSKQQYFNQYIEFINHANIIDVIKAECAVFLLDGNGAVLGLQASGTISKKLTELEIDLGSILSQAHIGTTAFSISRQSQEIEQLLYCEAYKKALHSFCMMSAPLKSCKESLYVMIWLYTASEKQIFAAQHILAELSIAQPWYLENICLLNTLIDNCNKLVFVFDDVGKLTLSNLKAQQQSNHIGIILDDAYCSYDALLSASINGKTQLKIETQHQLYTIQISACLFEKKRIIYVDLGSEPINPEQWKLDIIGHILWKNSYLDKIVKQRPSSGLRLHLHGDVGSGEQYVVDYLSKKFPDKTRYHLDCLAGFTQKSNIEQTTTQFMLLLKKANGHILHIENIEKLAQEMQAILLTVLSSRTLKTRNNKLIPISIDIISSSAKDNWPKNRSQRLLFLMLSPFFLSFRSLASDREKLMQLLFMVLEKISLKEQRSLVLSDEALRQLLTYNWPGNFFEVFQVIENVSFRCSHNIITVDDLPAYIARATILQGVYEVGIAEKRAIIEAIHRQHGRLHLVAKDLGFSRTTLWRKMKKWGLDKNLQ